MKQYLKMADVFCGDYHAKKMHDENGNGFSFMVAHCMEAKYAAHAINSHDELVQMNQELLAALEFAKSALEGSYDVNEWPGDGSSTCDKAIEVADIAIAKAKGGDA